MDQQIENNLIGSIDRTFETREELVEGVRRFCSAKGYAISIKRSSKDKYIIIGCDRGGSYRDKRNIPQEKRQRISGTRLINCPFEVIGKKQDDGLWVLKVKNDSHNHEPSSIMSGHPSSRRLTKEEIEDVEKMSKSGIQPHQIITSLKQKNPNIRAISKTIYNTKAKFLRESLGGRSSIQALLEEFGEEGFVYNYLLDENSSLTHVFFAHPKSIMLTRTYSSTFVMDCTYKTNKYKMPLLNIVGISSCNTTFYSCFAFLNQEREEDYVWALKMFANIIGSDCQPLVIVSDRELALMNAIRLVFPTTIHLLCIWHIEKNIVAKCKKYFENKEDWESFLSTWNEIVYAKTEEEFEKVLQLLDQEKNEVVSYVKNTWVPYKETFVSAWTEKHKHFGSRVSSRVEGAHAKLKMYLQASSGSLRDVKEKICLAIDNEFQEIKTQIESEKIRVSHKHNIPYFRNLVTRVSTFAMTELFKQYEMAKFDTLQPVCTGSFVATMGLSCAHIMSDWKSGVLSLHFIHSQWRIDTKSFGDIVDEEYAKDDEIKVLLDDLKDKYDHWPIARKDEVKEKITDLLITPQPLIHEPNVPPQKGRPLGSKNKNKSNSTKRDPSEFEIVEASRKCKTCQGVGHNSRTCQKSNEERVVIDLNCLPSPTDSSPWC